MTQINAYLIFNGNCREAMTFYQECLGGELFIQTVAETPMADQLPPEAGQNIMHSALTNGDLTLFASDMAGSDAIVRGNTVNLMLYCSTEKEIKTYFEKLSSGGKIDFPLADQFWGSIYGELTDKFGMRWLLNYDKPKE